MRWLGIIAIALCASASACKRRSEPLSEPLSDGVAPADGRPRRGTAVLLARPAEPLLEQRRDHWCEAGAAVLVA